MALIDMVNSYQELLEKKESLAEATKENNELIEAMKQEIAQQMIDDDCPRIASGDYMMEKQGITEKLKRQDNMEWTRRMNAICHDAEEMILTEMIYTKG